MKTIMILGQGFDDAMGDYTTGWLAIGECKVGASATMFYDDENGYTREKQVQIVEILEEI
jgi:hypothetical protein